MSILCDLFVADPSDAQHYEERFDDDEWVGRFERRQFGGLTQLEFEILWAIVEGRPWDPQTYSLEWIGEPPEGGESWLLRFPPAFVASLTALKDPREVAAIAAKWARTEELNCSPADIAPVVEALMELATSAVASKRSLFLWGSL